MANYIDSFRAGGLGQGAYILQSRTVGEVPLIARGVSGQTANLFEAQNNAGTSVFSIDNSGNITFSGTGTISINQTITGSLTVNGNTTLGNASSDTLTTVATSTFQNPVTMSSTLDVTGITTTQSLISTPHLVLRRRGSDPSTIGAAGRLYTRQGDTDTTELFYLDAAGNVVQITDAGALEGSSLFWDDDEYIRMGNTAASPDVRLGWNTTQTVDGLYLGLSDGQNTFVIAENGDRAFDFAHAAQTNPTLFIHSAAQSTTQWVCLAHDQTNALFTSGAGSIVFSPANSLTVAGTGSAVQIFATSSSSAVSGGIEIRSISSPLCGLIARGSWAQSIFFSSDDGGNQIVLTNYNSRGNDHDHALTTNPTFFIHSDIDPDVSNNQWGSLAHNQTDLVLITGDATGAGTGATTNNNGFSFQPRGAEVLNIQGLYTTGTPTLFTLTGAAHTGITAATEDIDVNFNLARNKTWVAGAGPLATQRDFVVQAATYVGNVAGALTISDAYTFYVTGAPTQGANMTLTRAWTAGFGGNIGVGAGTAALPSYSFTGDPNTGMYSAAGDQIGWAVNGAVEMTLNTTNLSPGANDGSALGVSGTAWSDLFLASTAVINFDAGDVTITHSANTLAFAGATSGYTFDDLLSVRDSTDAASVQIAIFEGDRATITDGDAAYITFRLSDSAGNQDEQARITWSATTVADGATQDGDLIFSALVNNVLTTFLTLDGSASQIVPAVGINAAGITSPDLGVVTTIDINGGTIDGVTIGGSVAGAITGTTITATSFVIGANTLTTAEWAFLDGQNQSVFTTSSPTFVNLTITSFAANWTNAGRTVADLGIVTTVDINGGTVDGVIIGGASAQAGTFTSLVATSLDLNGALDLDVAGLGATITNTTDAASVQSVIFEGDRATMVDNDEAYITFRLSDDGGTQTEFARLSWVATDVNVGTSVDGRLDFAVVTAGVLADELRLDGAALAPSADDGLTLGNSTLGWADIYLATGANVLVNNANTKRTIILSASGGAPTTTIPCAGPTKVEAGTNDIDYYVLDFDTTSEERAFWNVQMPDNYDGSTVLARFIWTNAAGLATETVDWGIKARSYANDEAIDQAFGAEVTTTDTFLAQGDVHISAESTAITIGGTPAGGEWVVFNVGRKVASDNLTGDARLLAVQIEYGISSFSD